MSARVYNTKNASVADSGWASAFERKASSSGSILKWTNYEIGALKQVS